MLITPEGDSARRRHAHTACVLAARRRRAAADARGVAAHPAASAESVAAADRRVSHPLGSAAAMARDLRLGLNLGYWPGGPPPGAAETVKEADRLGL